MYILTFCSMEISGVVFGIFFNKSIVVNFVWLYKVSLLQMMEQEEAMLDPAIDQFFAERKENWIKKNIKASMTEVEVHEKEQECEEVFALKNWLPNAAKRAGQMCLSTHPCTFSHPSARKNKNGYASSVISEAEASPDGFLRTGNVQVEPDALGNAAALDVYKFLTLIMQDQQTLLTHIEQETELADSLLEMGGSHKQDLRHGFLEMVATKEDVLTSSKIKQVYFPLFEEANETSYHLLSVLTHSGHLFELRRRVDHLRFSEATKEAREKRRNNQYSETGYQEIYNLTTIGFGGTKPQNISVLNNQNAGKAHLLLSLPPELSSREVRLPTRNFFTDSLNPWHIQDTLQAFSRLLETDYNNVRLREGRDFRVQEYVDFVVQKMWQVRLAFGESVHSRPEGLPAYQKVWLFPEREAERKADNQWLDQLIKDIARSFNGHYKKVAGLKAIQLGDAEHQAITAVIELNKEAWL